MYTIQSPLLLAAVVFVSTLLHSTNAFNQLFNGDLFKSPKFELSSSKSNNNIKRVAISGSSGLVGSTLRKKLEEQNIVVLPITRKPLNTNTNQDYILWDIQQGTIESNKLEGIDAVVHLAGEGVASGQGPLAILGRWDGTKKQDIFNSRVSGTKLLVSALGKLKSKPKVFISASAVGYYPYKEDNDSVYEEGSRKGDGFLANVCESWEREALQAQTSHGIRTVITRFGVILSKEGGLLKKLLPLFNLGGGAVIGSGSQGFSAVSLSDTVNAIDFILKNYASKKELSGPVNVCAPEPSTNAEFTAAFGR